MPSYQERSQIIKALAEQEYFDALQKEQNKSVQIGAKRGDTGRHQVIHSDGGVTSNGDKIFNASIPQDGFVRGIASGNAIALEHRNVKPQPRRLPQEEVKLYPVKVVYVVYPDDYNAPKATVDFYIGGDRPEPELILQLPTKKNGEYISFYLQDTKLTNTGNTTDDWILQLTYNYYEQTPQNYTIIYCQTISPQYGNFVYRPESNGVTSYMNMLGYGAFIDYTFGYSNYPYYSAPSGVLFSTHFTITEIRTNFYDTGVSSASNRVTLHQLYPHMDTTDNLRNAPSVVNGAPAFHYQERTIGTGEDILFDDRRVIRNFFTGSSGTFPSTTIPSVDTRSEFPVFYINSLVANAAREVQFFNYKRKYIFSGGGTLNYPPVTGYYFDSNGNITGSYSYQNSLEYYGSKSYQAERTIPSLLGSSLESNTNIVFPQTSPDAFFNSVGKANIEPNDSSVVLEKELLQGEVKPNYYFLGTNGFDTVILVKETRVLQRIDDLNWLQVASREIVAWVSENGSISEKECPNTKIIVYVTADTKANNNFVNYNRWIGLFLQSNTLCKGNQIQIIGQPLSITGIHGKNPLIYSFNVWQDGIEYPVNFFKHEIVNSGIYTKDRNVTGYSDLISNPDISSLGTVDYIKSLGVEGDYRDFPYKQGDKVFVSMYEWDKDFNLKRVDLPSDTVEYFSVDTGSIIFQKGYSYPTLWSAYLDN